MTNASDRDQVGGAEREDAWRHQHRSEPIFLVSERTQHENLGDIVLNMTLLRTMAQRGRVLVLRDRSALPRVYTNLLDQSACERLTRLTFLSRVVAERLQGRTLILCLNPGGYRGRFSLALAARILGLSVARLFGIKLIRVGVSLGPFTQWRSAQERILARLVNYQGLRDRRSLDLAQTWGARNCRLVPDLAFAADDVVRRNVDCPRKRIVVSMRSHHGGDGTERMALYDRACGHVEAVCRSLGLELCFAAQVRRDGEPMEARAKRYGATFQLLDADDDALPKRMAHAYGSAALLVTNRLHAGIFGMMNRAIPLFLVDPAKDAKIVGMVADWDLPELLLDETSVDGLAARLRMLLGQAAHYRARLAERVARSRDELRYGLDDILARAAERAEADAARAMSGAGR